MTRDPVTRRGRAGRRLLAALLAVLIGVLGAFVLYQTSVQPGAALVKAVFEGAPELSPPAAFNRIGGR